jgi:8-oxo-dGTP diphosphatase
MNDIPVFGNQLPGHTYVHRPSAYALIRNAAGEWAVVRTPNGCFLPGGGMETDESPQETVEREAREECGFVLETRPPMASALEYVYSVQEKEYFAKESHFLEAVIVGTVQPEEDDHELLWLSLDHAVASLLHESHRWALERVARQASSVPL